MGYTTAFLIASAAISAIGAISSGMASSKQAKFQAALARQRAEREREIGELNADERRREGSRLAAQQRARLAAAGVEPDTGTALLLDTNLNAETEFQALLAENAGATQAAQSESQARGFGLQASAARNAGFFRAGSTLLSAAGRFGGGGGGQTGEQLKFQKAFGNPAGF